MAIKDINVMSVINQELAKMDRRGGSRDYVDVISDAMQMGMQQKAWNEKKNAQRQKIMSDLSRDTGRLYNNEDAKFHKDRFKKYYDKYKGSMDESTLEMGQMMLDNYDFQIQKNDSFNAYKSRQDDEMKKVSDYINKNIEIGKEYTDKDLEEFRNVYKNYINYTEEFTNNHADRLELKANRHINQELAQSTYMNDYMLDSFFDDKKIDKVEYQAYKEASARNSIQPILDYNEYHAGLVKSSSKALVEEIEKGVQEYKGFKSVINDSMPVPKEWSGTEEEGLLFSDLLESQQEAIENYYFELGKDIRLGDKKHVERHGTSYVDFQHEGLFDEKVKKKKDDQQQEEKKVKFTEKELNTTKKDVSKLSSEIKTKEKKLSQLKKNKEKGYNIGEKGQSELDSLSAELPSLKSDLISQKQLLAELNEFKRARPISEEKIKKVARRFLKEKGLEETPENMKTAIVEVRNYLRKDAPDIWGTQVKRGDTRVPFYMTGERMPKP